MINILSSIFEEVGGRWTTDNDNKLPVAAAKFWYFIYFIF